MSFLDRARARAHAAIARLPGKAGELARKTNEVLGRPLADEAELADRRAFEARTAGPVAGAPAAAPAAASGQREAAPVIVYHMDKTRRDAVRLTEILDGAGIPYKVMNLEGDPAAQAAVRRDSKGFRLPLVFIAGEVIGGRAELTNLATSGALKKKVFG
ncbi:MAG TPA: glutaredoxin domain-containing protein [Kofleriaceae bacterium]|nr:glutaredoxin domain-containing protein [Kofleriaceae bacterium]